MNKLFHMKQIKKYLLLCFLGLTSLLFTGCDTDVTNSNSSTQVSKYKSLSDFNDSNEFVETVEDTGSIYGNAIENSEKDENKLESIAGNDKKIQTLSLDEVPEYTKEAYIELNNNQPTFTDEEKQCIEAFECYSKLDSAGRCGVAYANICKELMPTQKREPIGHIKPSGWHTVKYNDIIEDNYLYNRCHLVGYQLSGENANEKNLITGTRYLNVTGMLPFENEVADYVDSTGNHVLYRVTPVFEGNNAVASGVQMEAWSVEDAGKGVCFNVFCYNVQPGIEIDYVTGESQKAKDFIVDRKEDDTDSEKKEDEQREIEQSESERSGNGQSENEHPDIVDDTSEKLQNREFIINTNTKKFHIPSCSSVKRMSESNRKIYTGSAEDLKSQGYAPCKNCIGY